MTDDPTPLDHEPLDPEVHSALAARLRDVPVDPRTRSRHLTTALEAWDAIDDDPPAPSLPVVDELARRRSTRNRTPWAIAAAAAVAVVGIGWGLAANGSSSGQDTMAGVPAMEQSAGDATASSPAPEVAEFGDERSSAPATAGDGTDAAAATSAVPELGDFADDESLAAALGAGDTAAGDDTPTTLAAGPVTDPTGGGDTGAKEATVPPTCETPPTDRLVGYATVDGRRVAVVADAVTGADAVVDLTTCVRRAL